MPKNDFWNQHRVSSDPRSKPSSSFPADTTQLKAKRDSLEVERRKASVTVQAHVDSAMAAPFTHKGKDFFSVDARTHFKRADKANERETKLAEEVHKTSTKLDSARTASKKKK